MANLERLLGLYLALCYVAAPVVSRRLWLQHRIYSAAAVLAAPLGVWGFWVLSGSYVTDSQRLSIVALLAGLVGYVLVAQIARLAHQEHFDHQSATAFQRATVFVREQARAIGLSAALVLGGAGLIWLIADAGAGRLLPEWLRPLASALTRAIGWVFSPAWLPPRDFEIVRWLVVPGYGYGFLLLTFAILELTMPEQRRKWTRATLLSGTYLLLAAKMGVYTLVITPVIRNAWVAQGLPSLHLDRTLALPLYMPLAILVATFTAYWSHRLMHRIPVLWNIHKVHHSVTNLNVMSAHQMHFLEYLVHSPMHVVATLWLGTDLVAPFGVIFMAVDYLAHSNVRANLGALTYVICTPQAHRVHHSAESRHFDTNFGNTFMLWDHVFGTFHYDPAQPPTRYGISEEVPQSFVKQQLLPLVWIAKSVRNRAARALSRLSR